MVVKVDGRCATPCWWADRLVSDGHLRDYRADNRTYLTDFMWIFGYGSLIWRPNFEHVDVQDGYIRGWTRRFWQGSTDHRGRPGAPGRVVTLVEQHEARVWGRAYQVDGAQREAILAQLDHREKGGYERRRLDMAVPDGPAVRRALVYLATPDNPAWQGPASAAAIAQQISQAHGPSGDNAEYLVELAAALRAMGADDDHVFAVERALRTLESMT